MGQIASSYPTAGGLYHWSSILGTRFTRWLTAWLNLLGLVTVLGAINVGTWGFFAGAIAPWFPSINVDTTVSEGFVFLPEANTQTQRGGLDCRVDRDRLEIRQGSRANIRAVQTI